MDKITHALKVLQVEIDPYSYTHWKLSKLTPTPPKKKKKNNSLPFKNDGWKIKATSFWKLVPFSGDVEAWVWEKYFEVFLGGILGGIGHLDNSPTMVTKRTNFNPGMTRRKCQRRRLGRKSTNIWVSSHPSNKKATSHHTSARNWKIWTQFWQTLFVQQGCKQEKTQTHTQPITRLI